MSSGYLNLGVAGLGRWGKNVVRSFSQARHCNLAYLCDASAVQLAGQVKLYPQARAVESFEAMLEDDDLDAVAIATPAPAHFEMAKSALLAGKHVYVEKPMTLSEDDAETLIEISDMQKRKLMVGHLLEYHPAVNHIKRHISEGELGDVYYMYCQRLNLGVVRNNENAFWSLAPHDISVILYLFGQEPCEVKATGQCFLQRGVEDVVFVSLRFPDGKIAQIHVSWLDPHKERKMVLVGSEKMLIFDDMHPTEKLRIFNKGACLQGEPGAAAQNVAVRHGDIFIPHIAAAEPLAIETQHFVDCILNDTAPRSDGQDGLRVVRILEEVSRQLCESSATIHEGFDVEPLRLFAA